MKQKSKTEPKWTLDEIMEAWSKCDHIHLGGPNYSFVEWQELMKALKCVKSGKNFRASNLVRELAETMQER